MEILAAVGLVAIATLVAVGAWRTRHVRLERRQTVERLQGHDVRAVIGMHFQGGGAFLDADLTLGSLDADGRRVRIDGVRNVEPDWKVYRDEAERLARQGLPLADLWGLETEDGERHVWQPTRSQKI